MVDLARVPSIRASALVAASTWSLLHLALALLYLGGVRHLASYAFALVICGAGVAWAVRPLVADVPASSSVVLVVVALSVPLTEVLVVASLHPSAIAGYANWPPGATGVVLAGLVLRGRGWLALGAGAALVAVQTIAYVARVDDPSFTVPVFLAVPPELWLLGTWAVRRLIRRANDVAVDFRRRAADDAAAALVGQYWHAMRTDRLEELESRVLPFLAEIGERSSISGEDRERAGLLAEELRDGLRARALLDPGVRTSVAEARARGVRVVLSSDLDEGTASEGLRVVLPTILALGGLTSASVRAQRDPVRATAVLVGDLAPADLDRALGALTSTWRVATSTAIDDGVVVGLLADGVERHVG